MQFRISVEEVHGYIVLDQVKLVREQYCRVIGVVRISSQSLRSVVYLAPRQKGSINRGRPWTMQQLFKMACADEAATASFSMLELIILANHGCLTTGWNVILDVSALRARRR